jgi:hypothetical protein
MGADCAIRVCGYFGVLAWHFLILAIKYLVTYVKPVALPCMEWPYMIPRELANSVLRCSPTTSGFFVGLRAFSDYQRQQHSVLLSLSSEVFLRKIPQNPTRAANSSTVLAANDACIQTDKYSYLAFL